MTRYIPWTQDWTLQLQFFHTDSPTRAGGAAIYVDKVLKAIPRPDLKIDLPLVESCWVEIDPNNNRKHIMIGCIYKHPTANVVEFTLKCHEFLHKLIQTNTICI